MDVFIVTAPAKRQVTPEEEKIKAMKLRTDFKNKERGQKSVIH